MKFLAVLGGLLIAASAAGQSNFVQSTMGQLIPLNAIVTNGGPFNASGATNISGFQLSPPPGPFVLTISAQNGDSSRIIISQSTGETFYDSIGNPELQVTPSGATFPNGPVNSAAGFQSKGNAGLNLSVFIQTNSVGPHGVILQVGGGLITNTGIY
jgi:hypothetical protein